MSTFTYTPARNVCSDKVCNSFVATADSALACTPYGKWDAGGWPAAGGRISIQFFGSPCTEGGNPSLNICFQSAFQLAWCSPPPNRGENYDPFKFITNYGYFSTPTSVQGTNAQLRWSAVLQNATQTELTVLINIEVLSQVAGNNVWNNWYTNTFALPIVGAYQRNAGNNFKSFPEYFPLNVQNPACEIKYISINAGLEPLRFGCGVGQNDYTCGLYDGNDYITCARGLVQDKSGVALPVPFLFGLNTSTCGSPSTAYCNCDQCEATAGSYSCYFNTDPTFVDYVKTNFNETLGYQQGIQIATGAPFPVMLKLVDGIRYVYFCPSGNLANWERQAFNVVQTNKPTIVVAENADWKITVYFTTFPSADLLPVCPPALASFSPDPSEPRPDAPIEGVSVKNGKIRGSTGLVPRVAQVGRTSGGCNCGRPLKNNWHPEKKEAP